MSKPAILMLPLLGTTAPVKLLKVVLLPAPLTPNKAKHSPYCRPKDKSLTAVTLSDLQHFFDGIVNNFLKPLTWIMSLLTLTL